MGDLTEKQRNLGYALLGTALSVDGLAQTRNIMKLNAFLGDYNGGGKETLTEGHYYFTFMGAPSTTKPWGFSTRATTWPSTTSSSATRSS
ncbi:DUF3500 domain-containing protein [Streptomyces thinghirensis]|nr:DUF3500 domain-containing protein [Streptomyces thinghirensis]